MLEGVSPRRFEPSAANSATCKAYSSGITTIDFDIAVNELQSQLTASDDWTFTMTNTDGGGDIASCTFNLAVG